MFAINKFSTCTRLISVMGTGLMLLPFCSHAAEVSYQYDARHRLVSATYDNGATVSYTYDTAGNRLTLAATAPTLVTYEDAEDESTAGWSIYDADPAGATITNVYDSERDSQVIELTGDGTENGFELYNDNGTYWSDSNSRVIEWSMQFSDYYVVYIAVQTSEGLRFLCYTPEADSYLGEETEIHFGLGESVVGSSWHTVVRDLEYDLKLAQPDNTLVSIQGFLVRGSGKVDDIKGYTALPDTLDSDSDGITDIDEINTYDADSDDDGISDGDEIVYWETNWSEDPDGDGIVNLLAPDADSDGIVDGFGLKNIDGSYWDDGAFKYIAWNMQYDDDFTVYIAAQTKGGFRYLNYTPEETN